VNFSFRMSHRLPVSAPRKPPAGPAWVAGPSPIHGRGLFAARPLATGERVLPYAGERIGKRESARRAAARGRGPVLLFELNSRHDLDGGVRSNPARFLNHSCAPNCEAVAVRGRVWIRARRAIARGEELTFDYGFRLAWCLDHPCHCGAPACAGFIVNEPQRRRLRLLLGRSGRPGRAAEVGA
jgi:SET domain-containing protein